jgi:hypothetical protein
MSLTDEPTANSITAVWHDDENTAERWFSLISSTYHETTAENDGNPPDFDSFWTAFDSAASPDHGANVEAFRGYLANVNDPMAVIADLAGDAPDAVLAEVVSRYREGLAAALSQQEEVPAEGDGGAEDGEPYDDSYWSAYLQRWAGAWDGAEDTWAEFAEGFAYWAGEEPKFAAQLREQADALLSHAVTLMIAERAVYLSDFGVVAAAEALAESAVAETENAELVSELASTDVVTAAVNELLANEVPQMLAEALKEFPEAADLTPEEINEVLEQVLTEQLTQTTDA